MMMWRRGEAARKDAVMQRLQHPAKKKMKESNILDLQVRRPIQNRYDNCDKFPKGDGAQDTWKGAYAPLRCAGWSRFRISNAATDSNNEHHYYQPYGGGPKLSLEEAAKLVDYYIYVRILRLGEIVAGLIYLLSFPTTRTKKRHQPTPQHQRRHQQHQHQHKQPTKYHHPLHHHQPRTRNKHHAEPNNETVDFALRVACTTKR
jgi:hypothetical protein